MTVPDNSVLETCLQASLPEQNASLGIYEVAISESSQEQFRLALSSGSSATHSCSSENSTSADPSRLAKRDKRSNKPAMAQAFLTDQENERSTIRERESSWEPPTSESSQQGNSSREIRRHKKVKLSCFGIVFTPH